MLKVLDLFSGIGGFSLGLERAGGFETVAFCEQDKFCQAVLRKHWPDVPIHDDVKTLTVASTYEITSLCQHLEKINTQMSWHYMDKECLCSRSQTFSASLGKQCTTFSNVEELLSVLNCAMETTTISIEEAKNPLIMPKTHLNMLYEKVLSFAKRTAKNADQLLLLEMEEREYKRTTATITNLWTLCGYVNNVIMNGTNTTKLLKGGLSEVTGTIDVITGGFP